MTIKNLLLHMLTLSGNWMDIPVIIKESNGKVTLLESVKVSMSNDIPTVTFTTKENSNGKWWAGPGEVRNVH